MPARHREEMPRSVARSQQEKQMQRNFSKQREWLGAPPCESNASTKQASKRPQAGAMRKSHHKVRTTSAHLPPVSRSNRKASRAEQTQVHKFALEPWAANWHNRAGEPERPIKPIRAPPRTTPWAKNYKTHGFAPSLGLTAWRAWASVTWHARDGSQVPCRLDADGMAAEQLKTARSIRSSQGLAPRANTS